jgi:hypothetical protein
MGLDDIAESAGTTTTRQCVRGVAMADGRDGSTADRLAQFSGELPCDPAAAAAVLRSHGRGTPIDESAKVANLAPVTAAKTLHRLGVEGVSPLSPAARGILRDWLTGKLARSEALTLTGVSEAEFALAAYVETHDPIEGAKKVTGTTPGLSGDAMVAKRDELDGAIED